MDVLLCTASINNLCLISLDRYWSVTQAVEYLKKRTPARAMFMIGFVWSFSALVSLPPLFGWKSKPVEGQCTLSEDFGYVLYSSLGSFYVPALVMVFVYARIFVAARSRARRNIKKRRKPPEMTTDATIRDKSTTTCTSLSNPSPPDQNKPSAKGVSIISATCPPSNSKHQQISSPLQIASSSIDGNNSPSAISPAALITPEIVVEVTPTPTSSPVKSTSPSDRSKNGLGENNNTTDQGPSGGGSSGPGAGGGSSDRCVSFQTPTTPQRGRNSANVDMNYSIDDIEESDTAPESPGGIRSLPMRGLLAPNPLSRFKSSPYGSTLSIADFEDSDLCTEHDSSEGKKVKNSTHSTHIPAPRVQASEAERHKRKVAKARERRATFILGLIMASFIGAWLPFFTMYLIQGICKDCNIDKGTFVVAFWLGYTNSAINPIIYTVFNRDFRKAFRKVSIITLVMFIIIIIIITNIFSIHFKFSLHRFYSDDQPKGNFFAFSCDLNTQQQQQKTFTSFRIQLVTLATTYGFGPQSIAT